jgi:hypothetical protein
VPSYPCGCQGGCQGRDAGRDRTAFRLHPRSGCGGQDAVLVRNSPYGRS